MVERDADGVHAVAEDWAELAAPDPEPEPEEGVADGFAAVDAEATNGFESAPPVAALTDSPREPEPLVPCWVIFADWSFEFMALPK